MHESSLSQLQQGERGIVKSIDLDGDMHQRLLDLGMHPNSIIQCIHIAPSGSPMAFLVKGTVIALRISDCKNIRIVPNA